MTEEFDAERAAKALGDVGKRLQKAGKGLYPGVHWKHWTLRMWDAIFEEAEREWENDRHSHSE